jgi:hypothetical protein
MKAEDFSAWLSAIAGLSGAQRGEALEALKRAEGGEARSGSEVSPGRGGARRRGAAAERMGLDRPAMSVWKARAAHIARAAKSSAGAAHTAFCGFAARAAGARSTRYQDPDGASAQEGTMSRSRPGKSLAKTAALCGVHPTTAFRWRHRFLRAPASDKPRSLRGIVEADETFILESFKGRWSDLPRKA